MRELTTSVRIATALVITTLAVACGGSKSPTAPSTGTPAANNAPAPPSIGVANGATIAGTVVGVSGGQRIGIHPAGAGATVSVMGTNVSSPIDASGRFTLNGVPSGDVQLQVTGAGVTATLTLTGVTDHERIEITIQVSGSSASADDETVAKARRAEIPRNRVGRMIQSPAVL